MAVASLTGGLTEWHVSLSDSSLEMYWCDDNANNTIVTSLGRADVNAVAAGGTTVGMANNDIDSGNTVDMSVARRFFYAETSAYLNVAATSLTGPLLLALISGTGANQKSRSWPVFGGQGTGGTEFNRLQGSTINAQKTTETTNDDVGFDETQIIGYGVGFAYTGKINKVGVSKAGYIDPYIVVGGEVGTEANLSIITDQIDVDKSLLIESPSENIHLSKTGIIFGDGVTETHSKEELKTIEFVQGFEVGSDVYAQSHLLINDIGFEVNCSATDTFDYNLLIFISKFKFYWGFIGSDSASGPVSGCIIKGAGSVPISNAPTITDTTFDDCDRLLTDAPKISNSIVKNSSDTTSMEVNSTANMSGMVFNGTGDALLFDFAGSSTETLDDFSFTGYTNDIVYTGTGVLTIIPTNGTVVGTTSATGGGSIDVQSSPVTLTIAVTDESTGNVVTDARVHIIASGGGTLPDGTKIIDAALVDGSGEVSGTAAILQEYTGLVVDGSSPGLHVPKPISGTMPNGSVTVNVSLVLDE